MSLKLFRATALSVALLAFVLSGFAQIQYGGRPFSIQNQKIDWSPDGVIMPEVNASALIAEDSVNNATKDVPYRFGQNFDVDISPDTHGTWYKLANGDRVWLMSVSSPNAWSINLFFDEWYMPPGASFFIYNDAGTQIFGSYNELNNLADGTFATYPCKGEKIFIEYYEPLDAAYLGQIHLATVTHAYRDVEMIARGIGDSGSCNNDIVCPVSAGWENEIRSVAMIVVNGNGICTGALINNTANNGFPYFLTANHCVGGSVASWVIRFNFQATTCGGSTSQAYQTANGTTLLSNGATSDYALLQINGGVTIPTSWNPYYAGWDSSTATPSSAVGVHHPSGDLKKISFENNPCEITNYGGSAGSGTNHIRVVDWDSGTTEPGSSGSPLFNQNHRIVGQLHGGGAACGNNLSDWYGRFNTTFPNICNWLAPGQCGLTSLVGYDPLISGVALDAQLDAVTAPTGTICGSTVTPVVVIRNSGTTTLTSFVLTYSIDGGTNATYNWSGSLVSGATVSVTLANLAVASGAHTFNVTVSSPNGGTDQNAANNSGSSSFSSISDGSSVTLSILTDCWGEEVSWNIENSSNTILYSQAANTLGDQVTTTWNFCLAAGCYDFNIFDSYGDGLDGTASGCPIDGTYSMTGPGGTLFTMGNADYGTGTTHNFCLGSSGIPGCTNPLACNYNPSATIDNGSCIIPIANDVCGTAQSLIIGAGPTSGSNTPTCSDGPTPTCGGTTAIKDAWYSFVYNGGTVTISTTLGTLTDTRIAVYSACGGTQLGCNDDISGSNLASTLTFTCGQLTNGSTYFIQVGGFQALTGTFSIQITSTAIPGCTNPLATNFNPCATTDDGSCIIPGCNDPAACNYNSTATQNDGSCLYPGCTDPSACNFNPAAGCSNGSCTYPGCTNPLACNYNAAAGCDNGSCTYPGCNNISACNYNASAGCDDGSCTYPGCNDIAACNYNASAGCDDGSCTYAGCTDPGACNYNGAAGCDDGSCDYSCLNCPGDFNDDNTVGVTDLLILLSAYGCTGGCGEPDLSGDGPVGTADLLIFLSLYGTTCN